MQGRLKDNSIFTRPFAFILHQIMQSALRVSSRASKDSPRVFLFLFKMSVGGISLSKYKIVNESLSGLICTYTHLCKSNETECSKKYTKKKHDIHFPFVYVIFLFVFVRRQYCIIVKKKRMWNFFFFWKQRIVQLLYLDFCLLTINTWLSLLQICVHLIEANLGQIGR